MNALRCPYRDRLLRQMVDSYSKLAKCDMAAVLACTEVPAQLEAIQMTLAAHLRNCPVCLRIDSTRREAERFAFNAPKPKVQPIR